MTSGALSNKNFHTMDYVYTPTGTDEFKNINLETKIKGDKFEFLINSNEDIAIADLEAILNGLQSDVFSKVRINMITDGIILLNVNGKLHKVELGVSLIKVKRISLAGK